MDSASLNTELTEEEKKKIGRPLKSNNSKPLKPTTFRFLTEDEVEKFEKYAQKENKTKSQILREIVLDLIDK